MGCRPPVVAAAALLAVLAAPRCRAQDLPRTSDSWSTATATRDLVVIGQAPARRVEEIARDLALSRSALLALAGVRDHAAPYPTTIVLLRDDKTFQSYARGESGPALGGEKGATLVEGVLTTLDRQGRVLALSLESVETQLPIARATLAADLVGQTLIAPPAWVRSGLAGLIGRMQPAGRTGDPPRLVEQTTLPRTAEIDLVRHLANPRSERSSQFARYLTLLRSGAPSGPAFEECFFASFEVVSAEVAQVAARGAPPGPNPHGPGAAAIELAPPAVAIEPARALAYDRAVLALGDLLVRTVPWNTVAAEIHFRAVLDQHPRDAAALRGVALARELDDRHEDAAVLWEQSLAASPDDRTTLMLLGWSRLDHFRRAVGARRGWEEPLPAEVAAARDSFTRAMAPPGNETASPHALHGFGATHLFARAGFDPGLAALERASRELPGDDAIAADRILLTAHAGEQELAWEMRRERLLDRVAPELDDEVEKLLLEEALHSANRLLLVDQKPEPAIALVRGAAQEVRDPARRREIEQMLGQMEQVATKLVDTVLQERFLADYQQAQKLAAQRRFDEARKLIEPYAVESVEPAIRDAARDVLRQLDAVRNR